MDIIFHGYLDQGTVAAQYLDVAPTTVLQVCKCIFLYFLNGCCPLTELSMQFSCVCQRWLVHWTSQFRHQVESNRHDGEPNQIMDVRCRDRTDEECVGSSPGSVPFSVETNNFNHITKDKFESGMRAFMAPKTVDDLSMAAVKKQISESGEYQGIVL